MRLSLPVRGSSSSAARVDQVHGPDRFAQPDKPDIGRAERAAPVIDDRHPWLAGLAGVFDLPIGKVHAFILSGFEQPGIAPES